MRRATERAVHGSEVCTTTSTRVLTKIAPVSASERASGVCVCVCMEGWGSADIINYLQKWPLTTRGTEPPVNERKQQRRHLQHWHPKVQQNKMRIKGGHEKKTLLSRPSSHLSPRFLYCCQQH